MAVVTAAVATVGVAAYGANETRKAGDKARRDSRTQAATQNAKEENQFQQTRYDQEAWRLTGGSALNRLAGEYGLTQTPIYDADGGLVESASGATVDANGNVVQPTGGQRFENFYNSPDYEFRKSESDKAVQRSAAATGGLFAGKTGKALARYSGDLASSEYNNYMNRLSSLANVGQTTNQNIASMGAASVARQGANAAGAQNVANQSYYNTSNAKGDAANSALGAYGWLGGQKGWF